MILRFRWRLVISMKSVDEDWNEAQTTLVLRRAVVPSEFLTPFG
jgi:hypothetical protein